MLCAGENRLGAFLESHGAPKVVDSLSYLVIQIWQT